MNQEEEEVFVLTRLCHSDVWILSENETVTIGSSDDADITVKGTHVSGLHASLSCVGKTWMVMDLSSENGLYKNGKKMVSSVPFPMLSGKQHKQAQKGMKVGDMLGVGVQYPTNNPDCFFYRIEQWTRNVADQRGAKTVAPSLLELKVTVPPNAHGEVIANETKLKDVGKFENLKHSKLDGLKPGSGSGKGKTLTKLLKAAKRSHDEEATTSSASNVKKAKSMITQSTNSTVGGYLARSFMSDLQLGTEGTALLQGNEPTQLPPNQENDGQKKDKSSVDSDLPRKPENDDGKMK